MVVAMVAMLDLILVEWVVALVALEDILVMVVMVVLAGSLALLVLQKNIRRVLMAQEAELAELAVLDIQRLLYQLQVAAASDYWVKAQMAQAVRSDRNIQVLLAQAEKMALPAAQEVLFMSVQDAAENMAEVAVAPDTD
jgi:hypothetical protein